MLHVAKTSRLPGARLARWLARLLDLSAVGIAAGAWSMGYGHTAVEKLAAAGLLGSVAILAVALLAAEAYLAARRAFVSLCATLIDWQTRTEELVAEFRALGLPVERHYDELPHYLNRVLYDPMSPPVAKRFAANALTEITRSRPGGWLACAAHATLLDHAFERYFAEEAGVRRHPAATQAATTLQV